VRCLPQDFPALTVSLVGNGVPILEASEAVVPLAQWYLFAPTLQAVTTTPVPASYVVITDSRGTPVWWKREQLGSALDAKVLSSDEIVWTVGGTGEYFIRDFTGSLLNTLTGDLDDHDLQPTPTGTFLVIHTVSRVCPTDCADMSPWGGSPAAAVEDAEIHEIDSASNVIWIWRTRDHIALSETGEEGWFPGVGNDIIHMNALEPDGTDAVLFSARHLNAIYRIEKSTGAIDWKLGGSTTPESLTVVGDTRPTALGPTGQSLSGQHDVRKWPDGTISVHDNGTIANRPPFVVRYQVDASSMTAEVVEEFLDGRVSFSGCCGSARRLAGGHWLVDWGEQSFFTELAGGAGPVLTVQYSTDGAFSYRAIPVALGVISADTLRDGMDFMAQTP
jgi:Arylsulfotransferase (ASST)